LLHHASAKVTHPDAPVTLLAHAIELYLKAFLRLRGVGIEEIKNSFGHDFKKLVDEASSRGLSLVEADMDIGQYPCQHSYTRYVPTSNYRPCGAECRGLGPFLYTIQPSSRAFRLAKCHAAARKSERLKSARGSSLSAIRFASSAG